jgi:hypothetical protein
MPPRSAARCTVESGCHWAVDRSDGGPAAYPVCAGMLAGLRRARHGRRVRESPQGRCAGAGARGVRAQLRTPGAGEAAVRSRACLAVEPEYPASRISIGVILRAGERGAEARPPASFSLIVSMRWLRVCRHAHTAHLGHRGGHERQPRVVSSAQDAARWGGVEDGMRLSTAWCARAPQRGTNRVCRHYLLTLQEMMPISTTCNQ